MPATFQFTFGGVNGITCQRCTNSPCPIYYRCVVSHGRLVASPTGSWVEIQGLFFYLSAADFHGFSQFGKPARFAAGDEHLAGDDFIQHEILPSRVQLTEHVV